MKYSKKTNINRKRLSKADAPKNITLNEKVMNEHDFIVSKTDTKGFITYCNQIFVDMSGYQHEELIGANHNIIRHPDMPKIAFKLVWDLIKSGKEFFGFVKNLRKDGGYYWVFAYIIPDYDIHGNIVGYTSFRRKPPRTALDAIIPIYNKLLSVEQQSGVHAAEKALIDLLKANNTTYNAFVTGLQRNNY